MPIAGYVTEELKNSRLIIYTDRGYGEYDAIIDP